MDPEHKNIGIMSGLKCKMFYIKHKKKHVRVYFDDILWIEAQGSSIKIVTISEIYMLSLNLSGFNRQVDNSNLYRIHRSYIVNLTKIEALNSKCVMITYKDTVQSIPIGKHYLPDINAVFLKVCSE